MFRLSCVIANRKKQRARSYTEQKGLAGPKYPPHSQTKDPQTLKSPRAPGLFKKKFFFFKTLQKKNSTPVRIGPTDSHIFESTHAHLQLPAFARKI